MNKTDFDLMLFDRIVKIQETDKQLDLRKNGCISWSGGYDSQVLSTLVDIALPNNQIPRYFANTGVEYNLMLKFVKQQAAKDKRIVIINNTTNIKKMLNTEGYPFKSKQHSQNYGVYYRNKQKVNDILEKIEKEPSLKFDYDFIHNLERGTKSIIKYVLGIRERERELCTSLKIVPNVLRYQFEGKSKLLISDKCCLRLKEQLLENYAKQHGKTIHLLGIRIEEGGRRSINKGCLSGNKDKITFTPLKVITDEFEEEFVKRYNVPICELYYPPYNFKRTGCKGCPFIENMQEQLNTLYKLFPNEYKQCLHLWRPVYDEYIRIGYRLKYYPHEKGVQMNLFDYEEMEE